MWDASILNIDKSSLWVYTHYEVVLGISGPEFA